MVNSIMIPSATHWGSFLAEVKNGRLTAVHPFESDPDPSPITSSLVSAMYSPCRVDRPAVRRGYLRDRWDSDSSGRGAEPFVEVSWDDALDLVASAIERVKNRFGNEAIFAGSYGWASAGRFHHAQSQIHRFMNCIGGYTSARDTYSTAAGHVVLRHVLGAGTRWVTHAPAWQEIAANAELVVSFGGLPLKNAQVNAGQVGRHVAREGLAACRDAGVEFVLVSPSMQDAPRFLDVDWLPLRPNSDTAVMLGLAHCLLTGNRYDRAFLDRYCQGFPEFVEYLVGKHDGQPKDPEWAERQSEVPAGRIRALAKSMAERRTLITVSWSVQRAEHGEQPFWMAVTLAAMLGQIGLPGRGIGFGLCAVNGVGQRPGLDWPALEQGENPVASFIPVARISDLLLNPGGEIDYDGRKIRFPDIRMIYWAGGNPFHHHQDINRLIRAWRRPETIIVNEPWWTASTRHADIVLPTTTALEREDFACSPLDGYLTPMRQVISPLGERRSDYEIFAALALRLGCAERFTEGRDALEWVRFLYRRCREHASGHGVELPDYEDFRRGGPLPAAPAGNGKRNPLEAFRADPQRYPLETPSGRIEIRSDVVAGFGYSDCPGQPVWLEAVEWLGSDAARRYPLHLLSNQPAVRLHSQLDHGSCSQEAKCGGREPILINSSDAAARGIVTGTVVRVFNSRGACLAGALVTDDVRPGVVQMATGAWYDPQTPGEIGALDCHGNPNVLTQDRGSSRLAQGPSAQSALVDVECYHGPLPPVRAFRPPEIKLSPES